MASGVGEQAGDDDEDQIAWSSLWLDEGETQLQGGNAFIGDAIREAPKDLKKKQKRLERDKRKKSHENAHTRERRALLGVLNALPALVPSLSVLAADIHNPQRSLESDASCDVEASLDRVEAAFSTEVPYRLLPEVFGPMDAIASLGSIVDRNEKYNEKHLPQEVSLVSKLWALAIGAGDCGAQPSGGRLAVIDIGAGNGCLALLAAIVLDAHAVLIDHTLPHEELRVECKVPEPYRSRILRINGDVADLDLQRDLEPLLERHGVTRAVVVAKHLCGVGTDLALDLVSRWRDVDSTAIDADAVEGSGRGKIALLGAVFATCCGHKIGTHTELYAKLHQSDPYLNRLLGGETSQLQNLLQLCTPCVAWRTTAVALNNRIMTTQVRAAEVFEDALQQPRLNRLRRIFPAAAEVMFVPAARSLQNRCILAGSREGIRLALGSDGEAAAASAIRKASEIVLLALGGSPLDLRPRGIFSSKFGKGQDEDEDA